MVPKNNIRQKLIDKDNEKGFIYAIVLIIGALVALKVFWGFDIVLFLKSPKTQEFLSSFLDMFKSFWDFIVVSIKKLSK